MECLSWVSPSSASGFAKRGRGKCLSPNKFLYYPERLSYLYAGSCGRYHVPLELDWDTCKTFRKNLDFLVILSSETGRLAPYQRAGLING